MMGNGKKIFKTALKWLGIALNVILVIILLVNVYTIAARYITKKEVIPVFGLATALVETGSMDGEEEDSVEGFSLIFIVKSGEYEVGDIITFDTGSSVPTTHRIIGLDGDRFITKGDSNNTEDRQSVGKDQIIGKVFFTIPGVGYVINFMKTPLGSFLLVLVCFLIVAAPMIFKSDSGSKDDADDKSEEPQGDSSESE